MRASEFITENVNDTYKHHKHYDNGRLGSIQPDVARALPATYVIPKLGNEDPYLQYRFGVAVAGAKGREQRKKDNVPPFNKHTLMGKYETVVSFDPSIEKWIDDALTDVGLSTGDKELVSTIYSEEMPDVELRSPVRKFKGVLGL